MAKIRRRAAGGACVVFAVAAALAGCGSGRSREEREARLNVYPDNYKADLAGALHAYVIDPTNIRDAYVSEPSVKPLGNNQNRYVACVRFNAKNSDGRYTGAKDMLAVFSNGRFDQFVELTLQPANANPSSPQNQARETCAQADYKRFPELESMKR